MTILVANDVTVVDLQLAVQALIGRLGSLSGPEASSQLREVAQLAATVDALRVGLVNVVRDSEVWRDSDPNGTPASFLRQEHVLDQRHAKSDLRAAESFDRYPSLARAARDGAISREKVDLILMFGRRNIQREAALPEFIDIFIELAQKVTVCELRRTLQLWADQIDPVTTAADDCDAYSRRELYVHQLGDGFKLDGFFPHEQGLQVVAALNAALAAQWRQRESGSADKGSRAANGADDGWAGQDQLAPSTAAQRADAFIAAIIEPILESGQLPTCGGAPATFNVVVPLERLANPNQSASVEELHHRIKDGSLERFSAIARATNGPGEMVISTTTAQKLSCDATVQRVVLSPAGKPLDIGRRTRVIPEQIRTALIIRDGGCQFPFCPKPAGWAEGHHVQHWSQGGSTSLDNLILLCSRHHHQVHSDNIPIELDADGIPRVRLEHRFRDRS